MRHPLSDGVLFSSWKDLPPGNWYWKNFTAKELACRHCGEYYHHPRTLDKLQALRDRLGRPIRLNSGHRCRFWNYGVGGAPKSAHLFVACDISTRGLDAGAVLDQINHVGFGSVGLYSNFIHADLRPGRFWFGSTAAKAKWAEIL